MPLYLIVGGVILAALASLFFSTLTYSLRDYSRSRLSESLKARNRARWLDRTVDHTADLIFATAAGRLTVNLLILIGVLSLFQETNYPLWVQYLLSLLIAGVITLICSVALPHAMAKYAGEGFIAALVRPLHVWRVLLTPVTQIMHATDHLVRHAAGVNGKPEAEAIEEEIEQDILEAVEEGAKEGVVDEQEREMIESVIEFNDMHVGQIMTARPEIVGLELDAGFEEVKRTIEQSGHSRIPVYRGTLDHIAGILYARDLLKHVGRRPEEFEIGSAIRPAFYVPETKRLRDLLQDFRQRKVHMAIVLDEYGGTAGLVTIEDLLEELVGDISDEHEPVEPAMLHRLDERTAEADARIYIDELNRTMGLELPEDEGYETLGGFISTTLGRIPEPGTTFEKDAVRFTILEAEPQKVIRARIELVPQPIGAEEEEG